MRSRIFRHGHFVCVLLAVTMASACGGVSQRYESEPIAIDEGVPRGLAPDQELVDAASTVTAASTERSVMADTVGCLSTRLRVAQLVVPVVTQSELPDARAFAVDGELGGVGLLRQPAFDDSRTVEELQQLSPIPLLVVSADADLAAETVIDLFRAERALSGLVFVDAVNTGALANSEDRFEALASAFAAGADIVIVGSLAELTPAIDQLLTRTNEDQAFAAIVDDRAARVLAAKGLQSYCVSAD